MAFNGRTDLDSKHRCFRESGPIVELAFRLWQDSASFAVSDSGFHEGTLEVVLILVLPNIILFYLETQMDCMEDTLTPTPYESVSHLGRRIF